MRPAWAMAAALLPTTYSGANEEEDDVLPIGAIYQSALDVDPGSPKPEGFGYGTWERWGAGRFVLGIGAGETPEALAGAATVTPAGSVSAPTFTGTNNQATNAVTAGTPAGTCSAPGFTGQAFSGVINHTHPVDITDGGHNHTQNAHNHTQDAHTHVQNAHQHGMAEGATDGNGTFMDRSSAASATTAVTDNATAVNQNATATNQAATAVNQSATTGITASSSNPAGGVASITPAGTVAAPTFTGSALGTHSHTLTPSGTCSAPTFTGQQHSLMPPSITAFTWKRVA